MLFNVSLCGPETSFKCTYGIFTVFAMLVGIRETKS